MRIVTLITVLFLTVFIQNSLKSQHDISKIIKVKATDTIDPENYNQDLFEQTLLIKLNKALQKENKDSFIVKKHLKLAAKDQALYMAKIKKVTAQQIYYDREFTSVRVAHYGGSMYAREIVDKISLKEDRKYLTYDQACSNLLNKLFENKKKLDQLLSNQFYFIGLGACPDNSFKRVYVSLVLGNFKSDNSGAKYSHMLPVPYTNKNYGLTAHHPKYCRKINQSSSIFEFHDYLTVEDNNIYLETNNSKALSKLLRNTNDGLAIDIIQKEQFPHNQKNIINYNNLNRGILLKPTYSNKINRKNKAHTKDNRYAMKVKVGELPEKLNDTYELNLVLIQNKSFCTSIPQSFIISTQGKYKRTIPFIANIKASQYVPKADSIIRNLRIPFEKNKYSFNKNDIEPYISLLNEPDFTIYKLELIAYSSIEGREEKNLVLQQQREKSILDVLQERQQDSIKTFSNTDFNWSDFRKDIENTKFSFLKDSSMHYAQQFIKEKQIYKELEPVLKNHRYAELKIYARYNIEGKKEPAFVMHELKKAIQNENINQALKIHEYILNKLMQGKYNDSLICEIKLPSNDAFSIMRMNQFYTMLKLGKISDSTFTKEINQLYTLNSNNAFITFNYLLGTINKADFSYLSNNTSQIQTAIDRLYGSSIPKESIDALNIKYQMKLISTTDSKLKKACINKLKEIVDIEEESINNSKKLAEIFIENQEYVLAKEMLEQWILKCNDKNLLQTYVSLCSINEWDMHTQKFNTAMLKLSIIDTKKFCNLFYSDKFSYRVFENYEIKDLYCKTCTDKINSEKDKITQTKIQK